MDKVDRAILTIGEFCPCFDDGGHLVVVVLGEAGAVDKRVDDDEVDRVLAEGFFDFSARHRGRRPSPRLAVFHDERRTRPFAYFTDLSLPRRDERVGLGRWIRASSHAVRVGMWR